MEVKNLPKEYSEIWEKCIPLFKECRHGDDIHALKVAEFILNYKGDLEIDKKILVPIAIMHDIGHSAILPEHFKYITGSEKITNGKLVHMLAGAKIAKKILDSVDYNKGKTTEIVDIISMHDSDQLKGVDIEKIYNTENKKIFHDIDVMDRFNADRIKKFLKAMKGTKKELLIKEVKDSIDFMFFTEFKEIAQNKMKEMEKQGGLNA